MPTDNPFYDGARRQQGCRSGRYGLRNPFSMSIDPVTGRMYIGDVGDNEHDVRRFEEVNLGARGANYGWPKCEGSCCGGRRDEPDLRGRPPRDTPRPSSAAMVYRGSQFPAQYRRQRTSTVTTCMNMIRRLLFNGNGTCQLLGSNFWPADGHIDDDVRRRPDQARRQGPDGVSLLRRHRLQRSPTTRTRPRSGASATSNGNQPPVCVAAATPTLGPAAALGRVLERRLVRSGRPAAELPRGPSATEALSVAGRTRSTTTARRGPTSPTSRAYRTAPARRLSNERAQLRVGSPPRRDDRDARPTAAPSAPGDVVSVLGQRASIRKQGALPRERARLDDPVPPRGPHPPGRHVQRHRRPARSTIPTSGHDFAGIHQLRDHPHGHRLRPDSPASTVRDGRPG